MLVRYSEEEGMFAHCHMELKAYRYLIILRDFMVY